TSLRHLSFLGETVSVAEGVTNPWTLVGQLSLVLFVVFTVDAAIAVWRRGEKRQALIIGGGITLCLVASTLQSLLVVWGIIHCPVTVSLFFLFILMAVGFEMSRDMRRAMQLSEDLHSSEERIALAAGAAGLRYWEWDIGRDVLWATHLGQRSPGPARARHRKFDEFLESVYAADREAVSHALAKSINHDGDYECEYRVSQPNGEIKWMLSRGRVEFNEAGKPLRMRGVSIDITERKRGQDALQESESRFRSIANAAPVMIWISGTDKLSNFLNQGWLDFRGRTMEQEMGGGWAEGVHPDDLDECLKRYVESFDARVSFSMEYRLCRHDGEYRWVLDTGVPYYDSGGGFLGYIGCCVDLTERKQAEEKFRLVVESSPGGILLVDGEGRIVLVNTTAEKYFGYSRVELVGQAVDMLLPERFRSAHPGHRAGFLTATSAPALGTGREVFARRKDGTEFPVEIGLSPIKTAEGMLVLTVIVDITARKQAEAEALGQRAELTHSSRVSTLGALASSLAHELNQPLSAILGNAQAASRFMVATPPDLAEIRGALEDIAQDTRRAGEVIRQMRALVRKDEPDIQSLDINRVISDVARLLHSDILARRMRISLKLNPALGRVKGDSVQLQQVILNLTLNALDAMKDAEESRREVVLRSRRLNDKTVQVEVSDGGTGITADRLVQLFEPFRSSKKEGLGLGLSICRSIIEAHHGRIWADNNVGPGATLFFTLPMEPVPTDRT
ncbi:MAG TPA: PAS domain S-box protein, partial [Candidatus Acidoferrum sp.]|nr:PAS domain S-box protein [Candidatus Acidoferrum sp.]